MVNRLRFWWRALRLGAVGLYAAADWLGLVVLILGVAAGITVPLVVHSSRWLTAVIVLAILVIVVLEGSYRVWYDTEKEREADAALAEAAPKSATHSVTFWDNKGTVSGDISNTYNEAERPPPAALNMVKVGEGSGITDSLVTIRYGPPQPIVLPAPDTSTPEERATLRAQLLDLAQQVEHVMAGWQVPSHEVTAQMGIPQGEFVSRHAEVWASPRSVDTSPLRRGDGRNTQEVRSGFPGGRGAAGPGDRQADRAGGPGPGRQRGHPG